jgi:hypothetical protein
MGKSLLRDYKFTPGAANVGTIEVPGQYTIEKLLLVTNVADNVIIYNFAEPAFAGTTATFVAADTAATGMWPDVVRYKGGYTVFTLAADTSAMSASDPVQIYAESQEGYGTTVRPWDFGTDAIERMRVSTPQSMIDADFEYGLQPTKWAGYGTVKGYPSVYEIPGVDVSLSTITTDYNTSSTTNSLITVTLTTAHGLTASGAVNVSGLNSGVPGFSRADGTFFINSIPNSTTLTYFARGLVGATNGQSLFTEETLVKRGGIYAQASIEVASVTSDGLDPSTITLNFNTPPALIPGTTIHVNMLLGVNANLATGPFFVKSTPTSTSLTYTARGGAAVTAPSTATLYALSNATILHRPADGGVILQTKTPTYAATVVRQSKRYFRYQSGKGYLWSSGTLFAPNYDIRGITADGTAPGATITIGTDEIDHGLQPGAQVRIEGVLTSGYEGTYTVQTIVDDYTFTVTATQTLGATNASLAQVCTVYVTAWIGAAVRAGMFDEQNGLFFEFDGKQVFACRRNSTQQLSGNVNVTQNSNTITGNSTRLTEQLRAGDKIVIRGMTHFITAVPNNTTAYITPDYRGIDAQGVRASIVKDKKIAQSRWNRDKLDGTGPSGHTVDWNKMQMIGIQYSWYGAGFVDFMVRGGDGNWVMVHRIRNNNLNNEAYMRSGNLPVRYSIENDSPITYLTGGVDATQTTIPAAEMFEFDEVGTMMIDNEIISYTGRSVSSGPGNFTGCTRNATLVQYQQGSTNNLTAGPAAVHSTNTGIIEISNTCSPTLSHWGSALIMDGSFDFDRGYMFNYQRTHRLITTSTQTFFAIRLAPSVSNSSVGRLGAKDLLNRSQLLLQALSVTTANGTSSGAVIVEGILNPKNFVDATWSSLNSELEGGQPSFAQVADGSAITWGTGSFALPGEQVFAFTAPAADTGSANGLLDLTSLKELTGAPLGGDYKYPDGPDIICVNVRTTSGTARSSVLLRWAEAQA